jgi:hypothetical protein
MNSRIMYIERKTGVSEAFIGRVTFSKSGSTIYYRNWAFASVGDGIYGNYYGYNKDEFLAQQNVRLEERERLPYDVFWISGPKKDGSDRLFGRMPVINIDDDVRLEYWLTIRQLPYHSARRSY